LASTSLTACVNAKVADFGLARMVAPTVSGALDTWHWLAPEVIGLNKQLTQYGCASDVYSFGICCWELATCGNPFEEYLSDSRFCRTTDTGKVHVAVGKIKKAICLNNLRPSLPIPVPPFTPAPGAPGKLKLSKPESPQSETARPRVYSVIESSNNELCPLEFRNLIQKCWQTKPEERPTFKEIIENLCAQLNLDFSMTIEQLNQAQIEQEKLNAISGTSGKPSNEVPRLRRTKTRIIVPRSSPSPRTNTLHQSSDKLEILPQSPRNDSTNPASAAQKIPSGTEVVLDYHQEATMLATTKIPNNQRILSCCVAKRANPSSRDVTTQLWTGSVDGSLIVFSVANEKLLTLAIWKLPGSVLCLASVGRTVWSTCADGTVSIWGTSVCFIFIIFIIVDIFIDFL
jgi:serine/threonine protein kinase